MQDIDIRVYTDFDNARADWEQVEERGVGVAYQKYTWCKTWFDAKGKALGYSPAIAIAYRSRQPVFVLPFQRQRTASVAKLSFMAAANSNQNTGLWSPAFVREVGSAAMTGLLLEICEKAQSDLMQLSNVARECGGYQVPLLTGTEQASPSPLFQGDVTAAFSDFLKAAKSTSTRSTLRRKRRHLVDSGSYRIVRATQGPEFDRIFQRFLQHRMARAREAGVPNAFADTHTQAFLHNLMKTQHGTSSGPKASVWALDAGGETRAVFYCLEEEQIWTAYANSFANDELAIYSPGVVLLMEVLEAACSNPEISVFDFGLGDEAYKHGWTQPVVLYDRLLAATPKGQIAKRVLGARQRLKAGIRSSEQAWRAVRTLRRFTARFKR